MARKPVDRPKREEVARCMFLSAACRGEVHTYEQSARAFGESFATHATLCDGHRKDIPVGRPVEEPR